MTDGFHGVLRCPVCASALEEKGNTLVCLGARPHSFDLASAGYVNLASSRAAGGGDDAELIRARTAFLEKGHYAPIADAVCEVLSEHAKGGRVLDAGCGEGYYSSYIAKKGHRVIGIDLSKRGVLHAAKTAKREGTGAFFAVAGIFDLPLADASVDAVVSLFAPVCEAEFSRVLKPGGVLLLVGAGAEHLFSLKRVLYDTPYLNEARADLPSGMTLLEKRAVRYVTEVEGEALWQLFSMTPYFYRTSREGKARLAATAQLGVDVDVEIAVYQKQ